jgi:hypothetical protein
MLIDVDKELDKYDVAALGIKVMAPDYSLKPKEETDNVVVADNTENAVVQSDAVADTQVDAVEDTQEQSVVANVAEDTPKAIIQGVVRGSKNFNDFMGTLAGAPGDALNYLGKNLTGQEDLNLFLGSKEAKQKIQSALGWLDENIMPDLGFNEYANEPFNYELYGEIVKIFSQFAAPAVPAAKVVSGAKVIEKTLGKAKLWVEGMKAPNPFIRSMVWGTLADAAAFPEMESSLTNMLTKYLLGQTPEERNAFGNVVVSVLEKNINDPAIVNNLRSSLDGLFISSGVELFVKAAVKGAKLIPWDKLFKEAEINTNSLNLQTSNTKL